MSYINIDVDLVDIWENIDNTDLLNELKKRINNGSIKESELSGIPIVITAQYSSNLIDDMKLKDIIPNLWKKDMKEIEQFFGKA